jgi:IS1 family transposase
VRKTAEDQSAVETWGADGFPDRALHLMPWGSKPQRSIVNICYRKDLSMYNLKSEKQESVIRCLVDGNSIRSTERITGVHRDTIMRLLCRAGANCEKIMDSEMRNLNCKRIQLDEIWQYVGKHQRFLTPDDDHSQMGDFWTFVALDADTRLIPTYKIGKRTIETTLSMIDDLSDRLNNRVQISSDSLRAYVDAIEAVFGANVDYAQIVKSYEAEPIGPGRYSPPRVSKITKSIKWGDPNPAHISTSYIERSNLTMRMSIRRMTRLTNAFSKKLENFKAAVALHFAYYNFCRVHQSLRMTPAMASGITDHIWEICEIV